MALTTINWCNETRKLRDLIPWEHNPRLIRDEQAERLQESREEFNQPHVFLIGPDDELYDGHQRLYTWAEKWGLDLEIAVRVASRSLTELERRKLTVYLHKGAHGEFDFDALANWGMEEELLEWGFDEMDFGNYQADLPVTDPGFLDADTLMFTMLPEQLEVVERVLTNLSQEHGDYPGNSDKKANALYHLASSYEERSPWKDL